MNRYASVLFASIDQQLELTIQQIYGQMCAMDPSTIMTAAEHRQAKQQIRASLAGLIQGVLGLCDNVGGVLPPGILGYSIVARPDDLAGEAGAAGVDIRENELDYADMWLEHVRAKHS